MERVFLYLYKKAKTLFHMQQLNIFCLEATIMAHDEDNNFCKNYLLLKAEAASCFDCVRVLHSNDLEKREFFNTGIQEEEEVVEFRYRWIIFISLVLQKLLLYMKKPMAALGSVMELALNFPAFNGGCRGLIVNTLTGL